MTTVFSYRPIDRDGARLRRGDMVRIVGMPDLSQMNAECREESEFVFRYLQKKYKKIRDFNEYGFAEITFRMPFAGDFSIHAVWIEPHFLRRKS